MFFISVLLFCSCKSAYINTGCAASEVVTLESVFSYQQYRTVNSTSKGVVFLMVEGFYLNDGLQAQGFHVSHIDPCLHLHHECIIYVCTPNNYLIFTSDNSLIYLGAGLIKLISASGSVTNNSKTNTTPSDSKAFHTELASFQR